MTAWLLNEIKSPEFWTSIAFLGVVFTFMRPFVRYLNRWAKKQAALVQKNREEARAVRKRAETLLKQYEAVNRDRETERGRLLAEADTEISFLEQEFEQRTADRIARKKQEMALRLKTIEENGRTLYIDIMITPIDNGDNTVQAIVLVGHNNTKFYESVKQGQAAANFLNAISDTSTGRC